MKSIARLVAGLLVFAAVAHADELPPPEFGFRIGALIAGREHSSVVEARLEVPFIQLAPLGAAYRYREVTPLFSEESQAQLLHTRHDLETRLRLADQLDLVSVAGYRQSALLDRPGWLGAVALGAGLASPPAADRALLDWSVTAGGYVARRHLGDSWWFDLHALWRTWRFSERELMHGPVQPSLGLAVDVEASSNDDAIRGLYKVGPVFEFATATGNRARFHTRWYYADGNVFYEDRESAFLLGIEVESAFDRGRVLDARDHRATGWLPLVWGQYDAGWGGDRHLQRFEMNAAIHDFHIADQPFTAALWYETRQEYRPGDYDNVSYSVSLGPQTVLGLESVVSQGQPLVLGCDYLHRSAHAIDPDASRVPPGTFLDRNNINLAPRFRLQTLGWDLAYRDPAIYQRDTRWLGLVDWRVTAGYDFDSSRDRGALAAQLGLQCDVATVQGFVLYARAIGSVGNETPDWLAEVGARRPAGRLFFRAERYGLEPRLAHGNAFVAGVGLHL